MTYQEGLVEDLSQYTGGLIIKGINGGTLALHVTADKTPNFSISGRHSEISNFLPLGVINQLTFATGNDITENGLFMANIYGLDEIKIIGTGSFH